MKKGDAEEKIKEKKKGSFHHGFSCLTSGVFR